jgi:selenide,water dikinase
LTFDRDPNLIVGLDRSDDAGVYRLTDEIALVQTVDFFTPIVDDPFTFGQIAVANSLSDVYAMGGTPICAMNIVGFPIDTMDISVLQEILAGGLDKMKEAGVTLVGGHSVTDPELKYGLSVTGTVHPDRVLTNRGILAGDHLVLTKPLGTGIVNTAVKAELAERSAIDAVVESMSALNRDAARTMCDFPVRACTDVTGFGLLGHVREMIEGSGVSVQIDVERLPFFPAAVTYANMGLLPEGLHRNRKHWENFLVVVEGVQRHMVDIVCDPQTSGGLLIILDERSSAQLISRLYAEGIPAVDIGFAVSDDGEKVILDAPGAHR